MLSSKSIRLILHYKKIIAHFGDEISKYLRTFEGSAELLITELLESHTDSYQKLIFPQQLAREDRKKIIESYIQTEEPNLNYLNLLIHARNHEDFPIDDGMRLSARRRYDKIASDYFNRKAGHGMKYGVAIQFSEDQEEERIVTWDKLVMNLSFSIKWIEQNKEFPTLFNNFIYLFWYTDIEFRSQFVSSPNRLGLFEKDLKVRGKREYLRGIEFDYFHMSFNGEMMGYYRLLKSMDIRLEDIFKWFFEEYLVKEFGVGQFVFCAPTEATTFLEKAKLISSEIDQVLKQFRMFVENGTIDRELFEMSSEQVRFDAIPSFFEQKYIYASSNECHNAIYFLFSDQSPLVLIKTNHTKCETFYELLHRQECREVEFEQFQVRFLKFLINQGYIYVDSGGIIRACPKALILKDIYDNQVGCKAYQSERLNVISEMVEKGDLRYGNSLFSVPEQQYLNYVLNRKDFDNGLDLRNKYIHGTHPLDERKHEEDYYELLKIMVLIIIKINEEFCLRYPELDCVKTG